MQCRCTFRSDAVGYFNATASAELTTLAEIFETEEVDLAPLLAQFPGEGLQSLRELVGDTFHDLAVSKLYKLWNEPRDFSWWGRASQDVVLLD